MTENNGPRRRSIWPLVVGLPLIAIVAAAAIFLTSGRESGTEQQGGQAPSEATNAGTTSGSTGERSSPEERASGKEDVQSGQPGLGEADAPVVMVEFADYQ